MSTTTKIQIDTKTFIRFWLVIIGFAAAGYLLVKASFGLMIIGAALFFALAISPLIKRLASIFPSKSRNFAIALAYIIVVGFIIAFVAIVFPTIINESIRFLGNLPSIIGNATDDVSFINKFGNSIGVENLQAQIMQAVSSFSNTYMKDLGGILTNSITSISNGIAVLYAYGRPKHY